MSSLAVRVALVLFAVGVAACDSDGRNGGPNGSATKFCQEAIARAQGDAAMPAAEICTRCCLQEVPYQGRIEDGKCICRR